MNSAAVYDRYWESGLHGSPEWSEAWFRRYMGVLIGKERVLDYGCGLGYSYQRQLCKAVRTYVAADVSAVAREDARKKGFSTLEIDAQTSGVDSPEAMFDGATCIEVFEHLFDPLQAARELFRVLKPGGVLVTTVPNFGYHAWRLMALFRAQVPSEPENPKLNRFNGPHIRFFSKLMLHRLLHEAGFTDIRGGSFDDASIWDVFYAGGPLGHISEFADRRFPSFLHLRFLQEVWPNLFARRLRAEARKPI